MICKHRKLKFGFSPKVSFQIPNSYYELAKVFLFVFLYFSYLPLFGQTGYDYTCGNEDVHQSSYLLNGLDDLTFTYDSGCKPLILKIRFVFLTRDDGFGSFDPDSPMISQWVGQANNAWNNINDPMSCEPLLSYNLNANVQLSLSGVHTIANTDAWNYRPIAQALSDYYFGSFCPTGIEGGNWPELKAVIDQFNSQYPETVNFFFIEDGDHLSYLQSIVESGQQLSSPWPNYGNIDIFTGCSRLPGSYSSSEQTYIIEANFFTEFYLRTHFGHIYYPDHQDTPNSIIAEWAVDAIGYHFNHELGHSILNQYHSPCGCSNLMESGCGYNPSKNHLDLDQLQEMHKTFSTTSNQQYIDCGDLGDSHCDILVENDVTLSKPLSVYGDLIVNSNTTLTVKSDVFLSDNSRIIVEEKGKLIVDSGKLSSLCNEWKGIKVYGGNLDFDVKFTNGATIENTSAAAVSMFAPEPWPQITQWGNGILHADNTTFNNTKRIVEFMSWSPLPNPSYIRDCKQNGGKWSITNWNCQGIEVRDNYFYDITNECIVTETGSFDIIGNEFNSGQSDILFNNVSAGIHTEVKSNIFNGANTGYNARGTTFAQNKIFNNIFQTGYNDVMNDGHNQYDLDANNITAPFGAASFDNGGGIADVHNNDFSGNLAGASAIGSNPAYNFFENCYTTLLVDNNIHGQVGIIHGKDIFDAANNCFTHTGYNGSNVQDIEGMFDPLVYLDIPDHVIDCRDVFSTNTNINLTPALNNPLPPDCGINSQGDESSKWDSCWPKSWGKDDVWNTYVLLKNELSKIGDDHNLSDQQKEKYKQIYERCFWRVRGYLFEIYIKEGNYVGARDLYAEESHDDAKVYIYSSYVMENDLSGARAYLNSIRSESEQLSDFITIQTINLDRLPYGPFYETSDTEINTVRSIALKSHPYAAYGKALHYALTGEVISSEMPDMEGETIQPRSILNNTSTQVLRAYPNPFSDNLSIELNGYENVKIDIVDFYGRVVFSSATDQTSWDIPTSTWNQGLYWVIIESEGEVVLTDKIFLIN